MNNLLRETVFGRLVHLVSGGKFFQPEEQRDPSRLQRYIITKSASTSDESIRATANAANDPKGDNEKGSDADTLNGGDKVDPEKGNDFQLIDWIENDPEVRSDFNP
jgi:hypothetical protein